MTINAEELSTVDLNTAVTNNEDTDINLCYNDFLGHYQNVTTKWITIAKSTTGFNCNVCIKCNNPELVPLDIRMLDKNGNVLWSKNAAIGEQGSDKFWCGSDVYYIETRSERGTCPIYIQPI